MIRPRLWIGSMNTIQYAPKYISHVGVQCILNVARECDYRTDKYILKIPMIDGWEHDFNAEQHREQTSWAVDYITSVLKTGDSLLVHCAQGKSRSVHVLAKWIESIEGTDYESNWAEILSYRPCVHKESFNTRYAAKLH